MDAWEAIAREAIRDLVARYNANGDSGRIEQVVELFAPDAAMDIEGLGGFEGTARIRAFFQDAIDASAQDQLAVLRHFTATHQIDFDNPERARGRCYFMVLTEHGLDHWGTYRDEYGVVDGCWRFQTRAVKIDGTTPGGWAERNLTRLAAEPS